MDNTKAALVAGIAGGYVLGRTKKVKLAFAVATYLAGRRIALNPRDLAKAGLSSVRNNPQLAKAGEQLRDEVMRAGRSAVTSVASHRVEALANALHTRTEAIRGPGQAEDGEEGRQEEQAAEEEEKEQEEKEEQEEQEENEEQEKKKRAEAPAAKRSAGKARTKRSGSGSRKAG